MAIAWALASIATLLVIFVSVFGVAVLPPMPDDHQTDRQLGASLGLQVGRWRPRTLQAVTRPVPPAPLSG